MGPQGTVVQQKRETRTCAYPFAGLIVEAIRLFWYVRKRGNSGDLSTTHKGKYDFICEAFDGTRMFIA